MQKKIHVHEKKSHPENHIYIDVGILKVSDQKYMYVPVTCNVG